MTADERSRAVAELTDSRDSLLALLARAAQHGWNLHPSPGAWSPAECAEHIVLVEEMTIEFVESYAAAHAALQGVPSLASRDEIIRQAAVNRAEKRASPPRARPTGAWTPPQAIDRFRTVRARTLAFAESTPLPLRDFRWKHTFFGEIDFYQTLLFLAAHSLRHARQIEEALARAAHAG
jgi:hypothetical protein